MRENYSREYAEADDHKFVTEDDAPNVSPSVSEGGTGLDLDFHHSEDEEEMSEGDLQRLQEMDEHFSEGEPLSEEEQLQNQLAELEARAGERESRIKQKQYLRELKKRLRSAKVREAVAPAAEKLEPITGGISRLQGLLNTGGEKRVGFSSNKQMFSLGENKFDMSFGKNQEMMNERSPGGVSPSVKAGHEGGMFGKRESAIQLGFGSRGRGVSFSAKKSGLNLGLSSGNGVSLAAMNQGGMNFGQQKSKAGSKKKSSKANKNKLDINLIIKR